MNAKEANELANKKSNVDYVLGLIKHAANEGNFSLRVSKLSDSTVADLNKFGYTVSADWDSQAILNKWKDSDAPYHLISWRNVELPKSLSDFIGSKL